MEFNKLIELDRLAKEGVTKYTSHRKLYFKLLQDKGKHFVGIIGPRVVGKTIIFIIQLIRNRFLHLVLLRIESFS
ncbi:MAG: hypothetical protein LBT58_01630 [Endomicrobium sp.]|jgi:predicted AAA+ superfamily ATPase|nr:hypothetical protein [Endomicrobium sp.]